ncbi:FabD/lysophospholipase-like protein [Mycena latifolia]|nr:FabD/lysophospholipase-like protein [Mycena latifolia]
MAHSENSNGLRLLAFDGGGIRGLSSLLILEGIMYRIQIEKNLEVPPLPCEYFDLICGTSTGGLMALMLGRLRMSVEDAIQAYDTLAQEVFSEMKHFGQDGKFKASQLEAAIQKIVKENSASQDPEEPMKDPLGRDAICRTPSFVCAQSAHAMRGNIPVLFRTYDSPHERTATCTIWEAARATSAAPTFFKRIEIGPTSRAEAFLDGGLGRNIPTGTLLEEAQLLFPNRRVACVLSIGTGQVKAAAIPTPSRLQRALPLDVIHATVAIATDCETTNQDMLKRFVGDPGVYFRFNVEQGMQNIKLGQWERLGEVSVSEKLGEVVNILKARIVVIPTAKLPTQPSDIR